MSGIMKKVLYHWQLLQTFLLSLMPLQNKIDCLTLERLNTLVYCMRVRPRGSYVIISNDDRSFYIIGTFQSYKPFLLSLMLQQIKIACLSLACLNSLV
jgi:hypothetical protein